MITSHDVLRRAVDIIARRDHSWSSHGLCCPWCAISTAKSELDEEQSGGATWPELIEHWFDDRLPSDQSLVEARKALAPWNDRDPFAMDQFTAETILLAAMDVA